MAYIKNSLSTGETIQHFFKLHWSAWLPAWFWLISGLLLVPFMGYYSALLCLLGAYYFMSTWYQEFGVTNKRVIYKRGIIARKTNEMKLTSIETVEIDQSIAGRIFGYGTVLVTGRGTSDLVYTGMSKPMTVKRQIESVSNPVQ